MVSETKDQLKSEQDLAESARLLSQENAIAFEDSIRVVDNFDDMDELAMKYMLPDNASKWIEIISTARKTGLYPFEIFDSDLDMTLLEQFCYEARIDYNASIGQLQSITDLGRQTLRSQYKSSQLQFGVFIKEDVLTVGMRPGTTVTIKGVPGTGKTEMATQHIILPISKKPNVQVLHNINLKEYSCPDNVTYSADILELLKMICEHAIKGILESGAPYFSVLVIDEAGIAIDKQKTQSNELINLKWLMNLSRKLGFCLVAIYQHDDVPMTHKKLSTHVFTKPTLSDLTLVEAHFKAPEVKAFVKIKGLPDWKALKKRGGKPGVDYIEFETWDASTLDLEALDLKPLVNYANAEAKGKPVGAVRQFERIIERINQIQERQVQDTSSLQDYVRFVYRTIQAIELEIEEIESEIAGTRSKKQKAKLQKSLGPLKMQCRKTYWTEILEKIFPNENWHGMTLKRMFDDIEKTYWIDDMGAAVSDSSEGGVGDKKAVKDYVKDATGVDSDAAEVVAEVLEGEKA